MSLGHGAKDQFYKNCRICGASTHKSYKCNARYCHVCGKIGHVAHDCPSSRLEACNWCALKGHTEKTCHIKELADNLSTNLSEAICFVCGAKGHLV